MTFSAGKSLHDGQVRAIGSALDESFSADRQTVLIYRLGSLGDTVVSLPCFHKVAQTFPNARRIALTNKPVSPAAPRLYDILDGSGLIDGAVEYQVASRSVKDLAALRTQIRRLRADTLIYLAAPRGLKSMIRDLVFFRLCGVKRVVGAPFGRDLQSSRIEPSNGEDEYECERLARSLAKLGSIDLADRRMWDLRLSAAETAAADLALAPLHGRPFIAVNMGGKAAENDWGEANWTSVLNAAIERRPEFSVVFIGAQCDAVVADRVAQGREERFLNLCGALPPRTSAAVLSRAMLFVGHDSGPLHLAAASGTPCVGVFSNRNRPHKWHPYGIRHRVFHSDGPISSIPGDAVQDAVLNQLDIFSAAGRSSASLRESA